MLLEIVLRARVDLGLEVLLRQFDTGPDVEVAHQLDCLVVVVTDPVHRAQVHGEKLRDVLGIGLGVLAPCDECPGYDRVRVLARAEDHGAGALLEGVGIGCPEPGELARTRCERRDDLGLVEVHDVEVGRILEAVALHAGSRRILARRVGGDEEALALQDRRIGPDGVGILGAHEDGVPGAFVVGHADRHDVEPGRAEDRGRGAGSTNVP